MKNPKSLPHKESQNESLDPCVGDPNETWPRKETSDPLRGVNPFGNDRFFSIPKKHSSKWSKSPGFVELTFEKKQVFKKGGGL